MPKDKEEFMLKADPPPSNLEETFLTHELILIYSGLSIEEKFGMLHVFTSQSMRKILTLRKASLQDRLVNLNLVTKDPQEFHLKFAVIRVELGLVDDVLQFLDQGLVELARDFPEQFRPKANDLPENQNPTI